MTLNCELDRTAISSWCRFGMEGWDWESLPCVFLAACCSPLWSHIQQMISDDARVTELAQRLQVLGSSLKLGSAFKELIFDVTVLPNLCWPSLASAHTRGSIERQSL